jgi:hypothetical protein
MFNHHSTTNHRLLFFALCAICLTSTAYAGAWTQKQGGYYFKLAANSLEAHSDFDADGGRVTKPAMGQLQDFNLAAYIEYGLRERLTLVASTPYKRLSDRRTFATGIGRERDSHLADLEMRLRWRWRQQPAVISLAAGAKIPLGYKIRQDSNVPLGTDEIDADIRLLLGRSLYPFPGYLTGELGYRRRGGSFSDEIFTTLEGGISWQRFLFKSTISSLHTLGSCNSVGQAGLIGDQNIFKVAPGAIYRISDRIEASLDLFHIASGCNTTTGNTLSLGLALKH